MLTDMLFGLFGLTVLVGIAVLFSNNRGAISWRLVGIGIGLQLLFAVIVILTTWGSRFFSFISTIFVKVIAFTNEGSMFIFGDLADGSKGFYFAFQVLPTIIFFSSLMSVLYHLGAMQKVVQGMAWVMAKAMRVSGAESISVAANVFIGQTEAPLVVRPYVSPMTQSELLTLMVGGMATIAGGVLAAYVGLLGGGDPQLQLFYAKHLLSASIMAAPATIVIAKVLVPETETSQTMGEVKVHVEKTASNIIDAAASGAADGLKLALNVAGMLLAFIALIAMVNWIFEGIFTELLGLTIAGEPITLQVLIGYALSPIAWLIGVPWGDSVTIGSLIGQKVIINEFVAYLELSQIPAGQLSEKATLIATYALCGFANFSSIAIQIGGIGGIAPDRRSDLAKFGLRAVLGGTLATMMTATIAGVLSGIVL
ncbi:MAG: NupC/NupG family nucleoside CNT transporter [Calditrichaeota bacterium]|nr:NupC/NupG family nucleoside CNT transporter [Calditrichota bacterium]MCB0267214.1 NupC/NupG family nucleoside CNT transporter [Calditrichota bacterium]MCB0285812.1 NupC/NupG family nucleoside CNT transporter [Calditrichota bacterium]MCB9067624.1 NupC/NupG family nucleoside CNT transporter [Calditrichia bacterium]